MEANPASEDATEVINLVDESLPSVDLVTPTATPRKITCPVVDPLCESTPVSATGKVTSIVTSPPLNNNNDKPKSNGEDIKILPFFIDSQPDYSYLTPQSRKKQKTKPSDDSRNAQLDTKIMSKKKRKRLNNKRRKGMRLRRTAELEAEKIASEGKPASPEVGFISLESNNVNSDTSIELIDLDSDDDRENQNESIKGNQNDSNSDNDNDSIRENHNSPNMEEQNPADCDSDIEVIEAQHEVVVLSDDGEEEVRTYSQTLSGSGEKNRKSKTVLGSSNLPSFISQTTRKMDKMDEKKRRLTLQNNKRKFAELMNTPAPSLRPVIIDGSNVAYGHDKTGRFSCRGLKICVDYFKKRGHKVTIFLPQFRRRHPLTLNPEILDQLEREGVVVFTPSRKVNGKMVVSYDDRYIVEYAHEVGGVIVSRDNYRDLLEENPNWASTINDRLLMYTWAGDMIMFPQDPLGRTGPQLSQFLSFPST